MQEQIDYLLKNPLAAKAIGGRGRQIVISLYGWKRVAIETMQVMEDSLLYNRVQGIKEIETPNTL